jgi:hypothetical protein
MHTDALSLLSLPLRMMTNGPAHLRKQRVGWEQSMSFKEDHGTKRPWFFQFPLLLLQSPTSNVTKIFFCHIGL